jgi:hypothetical protein
MEMQNRHPLFLTPSCALFGIRERLRGHGHDRPIPQPTEGLERPLDGIRHKADDQIHVLGLATITMSGDRQSTHNDETHIGLVQRPRDLPNAF